VINELLTADLRAGRRTCAFTDLADDDQRVVAGRFVVVDIGNK